MMINTFLYSLKQGFKNIFHNKMFSLASIATMAACIFMFGLFYIIITNFNSMLKDIEEGVAVTVFFEQGLSEEEIQAIGEEISQREEVAEMEYTSAEEAWQYFKDVYFEGYPQLAAGFENDNPLANSANYAIYLNDVSQQNSLVSYLESVEGIRSVKQSEDVANTLVDLNRLVSYISWGIILILLCVAIFLISNTVTVGISVRKEEIGIMKLIGATDFLVRAPFLVEGIVIGLVGAIIPLALLYVLYGKIVFYITERFNFIGTMLKFASRNSMFHYLVPIALLLGVGIGFMGSMFTIRKHLKV